MQVFHVLILFTLAAFAELLGSWLVWQGLREHRGLLWLGAGFIASGLYPIAATFQPSPEFGRILAAYGGIFIIAAFVWSGVFDGFRPDRYDLIGAGVCFVGVLVIMFGPRGSG